MENHLIETLLYSPHPHLKGLGHQSRKLKRYGGGWEIWKGSVSRRFRSRNPCPDALFLSLSLSFPSLSLSLSLFLLSLSLSLSLSILRFLGRVCHHSCSQERFKVFFVEKHCFYGNAFHLIRFLHFFKDFSFSQEK